MKHILFLCQPIPALTCPGTPELALHRKGNYGYLYASSAAFNCTSPASPPGILMGYAG